MCVLFNKRVFFSSVFHLCVLFINKRTVAEYALPKVEDVLIGVKGRSISEWLKKCYSGAQGCHRSRYTENNLVYRLFQKIGIFGSKGGCFAYCPKICKIWHFCKLFSKNGWQPFHSPPPRSLPSPPPVLLRSRAVEREAEPRRPASGGKWNLNSWISSRYGTKYLMMPCLLSWSYIGLREG